MSLDWEILYLRPHDMKAKCYHEVYAACKRADIEVPEEVMEFFEYAEPSPEGTEACLKHKSWDEEKRHVIEVKTKDIPEGSELIRIICNW